MSDPQKPTSFDISKDEAAAETQSPGRLSKQPKRPESFDLEDVEITSDFQQELDDLSLSEAPVKRPFISWGSLFWTTLSALVALAIGLWVDNLITELFARNEWLGFAGMLLTALFALATFIIITREVWAILKFAHVDKLRKMAKETHESDDAKGALKLQDKVASLYDKRPETANGRATLNKMRDDIIDGRDRIHLIERDLLSSLDKEAEKLVAASAKRVAIVTAVSPRALIDVLYVLLENIRLIRAIATLYAGRPGTLGTIRLFRNVLSHLAVTGAIAVGDDLIQQVIGHGLAARLSARFGEGVVNGLLTARIGLAAHDICRPVPFLTTKRPTLSTYMNSLTGFSGLSGK